MGGKPLSQDIECICDCSALDPVLRRKYGYSVTAILCGLTPVYIPGTGRKDDTQRKPSGKH